MSSGSQIAVYRPEEGRLNGLGMMMLQYMEQNLEDFEYKVKQGLRLRGKIAVEVEKGIATTVIFRGEKINIENGVGDNPDLYLKGSYILLSKVLSGTANPFLEILKGNLKLMVFPKRPFQSLRILRFLKIPPELLLEPRPSPWKLYFYWGGAAILALCAFLIWLLLRTSGE